MKMIKLNQIPKYLWEASGKDKVSINNPFKNIGFDRGMARLGWVKPPSWELIKKTLNEIDRLIRNKNEFIFIGMGGSINGVKAVISLKKNTNIHCIDSLDPQALVETIVKIKNINRLFVIPISKSGTTKETQLIAHTIRNFISNFVGTKRVKRHFLWLVDKNSVNKWKTLGWRGFLHLPIQFDERTDIGGRFTSPHTLIFFLPLFLIENRNLKKLKKQYSLYLKLLQSVTNHAFKDALKYKNLKKGYFSIRVPSVSLDSLRTWITQLFQESLGSKKKGFFVKTIVTDKILRNRNFVSLRLGIKITDPLIKMMCLMYYLENFVAYYAYFKKINFVNQPSVEKYKKKMKTLVSKTPKEIPEIDLKGLVKKIKNRLKPQHKFIEAVLYLYPSKAFMKKIEKELKKAFPSKEIFVFVGSDWNHHSYQAAYKDKYTFYILITRNNYFTNLPYFKRSQLTENVRTLKIISYATYLTIKRNSLLVSLKDTFSAF